MQLVVVNQLRKDQTPSSPPTPSPSPPTARFQNRHAWGILATPPASIPEDCPRAPRSLLHLSGLCLTGKVPALLSLKERPGGLQHWVTAPAVVRSRYSRYMLCVPLRES